MTKFTHSNHRVNSDTLNWCLTRLTAIVFYCMLPQITFASITFNIDSLRKECIPTNYNELWHWTFDFEHMDEDVFTEVWEALAADTTNWHYGPKAEKGYDRYITVNPLNNEPLTAGGKELDFAKGLKFETSGNNHVIIGGSDSKYAMQASSVINMIIPNCKKGDIILVDWMTRDSEAWITSGNIEEDTIRTSAHTHTYSKMTVKNDGDVKLRTRYSLIQNIGVFRYSRWGFDLSDLSENRSDADKIISDTINWGFLNKGRYRNANDLNDEPLMANGEELTFAKGLRFTTGSNKVLVGCLNQWYLQAYGDIKITVPSCMKGDSIYLFLSLSGNLDRFIKADNVMDIDSVIYFKEGESRAATRMVVVKEDGDVTLHLQNALRIHGIDMVEVKYTVGDANGDLQIDVADFTTIANYILGNFLRKFVEDAADVNNDEAINVADITGVTNIILYGSLNSSAAAKGIGGFEYRVPVMQAKDFAISAGGEYVMDIDIENPDMQFSACQFDVHLPKGICIKSVTLGNERTTSKKTNYLDYATLADGTTRVICASTKDIAFAGTEGTVARLTVVADDGVEAGSYDVTIDNIVLSKAGDMAKPESVTINADISSATGISEIKTEDPNSADGMYDILGRRISSSEKLRDGIYIIGGKKIIK